MKKKWLLSCATIALAAGLTFAFAACDTGDPNQNTDQNGDDGTTGIVEEEKSTAELVAAIEGEEVANAAAWEQSYADLVPGENANYGIELQMNYAEEISEGDQTLNISFITTGSAAVDGTVIWYQADYVLSTSGSQEMADMILGDEPREGTIEVMWDKASDDMYYKGENGDWTVWDPHDVPGYGLMAVDGIYLVDASSLFVGFDEVTYDDAQKGYIYTYGTTDTVFKIEDGKLTAISMTSDDSYSGMRTNGDLTLFYTRGGQDLTMPTVTA